MSNKYFTGYPFPNLTQNNWIHILQVLDEVNFRNILHFIASDRKVDNMYLLRQDDVAPSTPEMQIGRDPMHSVHWVESEN